MSADEAQNDLRNKIRQSVGFMRIT